MSAGFSSAGTTNDTRWILLAEDDDDIRQMVRNSLHEECEGLSISVVEARDGAEAITKAGEREFHCVITDLRMPHLTGVDLIRAMQSQTLNANTPTLVVSGHAADEFSEFCGQYDHIKIIPKPFEPQAVALAALREIKLGRLDERVSVHLMNPFLDAIRRFINDDLKVAGDFDSPAVKKPGETIAGDTHCMLTLTTGVSRARFCLSFDRRLLDWARANYILPRLGQGASTVADAIPRALVMMILERVAPEIKSRMGGTPRLSSLNIITSRDETEYNELTVSNGIVVVCRTEQGRLCAGAFARQRARRAS